jgi:diadenosine tetraphosphate (Ap4A) HIT family hydrolase
MACPICSWSPDNPDYLLLHETRYWRVVLASNQCLVGRCILHLKRHCGDVAETTPDEILEWLTIVNTLENGRRSLERYQNGLSLLFYRPILYPHA